MEFKYSASSDTTGDPLQMFSSVELTEFEYTPLEGQ
jgi:hypothetical protein